MTKKVVIASLLTMFLAGCAHHHHGNGWAPGCSEPPGQTMKRTGYNPASGKYHPHKGPKGRGWQY